MVIDTLKLGEFMMVFFVRMIGVADNLAPWADVSEIRSEYGESIGPRSPSDGAVTPTDPTVTP